MPYAVDGKISQAPLEGGVEITQEQYLAALGAILEGGSIRVVGKEVRVTAPPESSSTDEYEDPLDKWRRSVRVSALQARLALKRSGLLVQVEQLVTEHPDSELLLAWEYATEFQYESELLNQVAAALGLAVEDKDNLFRLAESIKA